MTEAVFIKIEDTDSRLWLGVNTPKYWTATHLTWNSCRASLPVQKQDLEKYKWIPLCSKQLVWWSDD